MHKKTHDGVLDYKVNELCSMCETLMNWTKAAMSKGNECLDTHEAGAAIDMIKDLCEAEEKLYKAEYYKTATEAMKENPMAFAPEFVQDQIQNDRAGYDNWRFMNGRFAPKGHGHPVHYTETSTMMPHTSDAEHMEHELKHGVPYRDYTKHRMYYTETHNPEDKHRMDESAKKHVLDTAETVAEIYRTADPDLKREIKSEFQKLLNQMIT